MSKKYLVTLGVLAALAVLATLLLAEPALAGKLEDAIAQTPVGKGPGMIHPDARQGLHGDSRGAASFLPVLHPVGHLGRLDLLFGGRLRRHHGRSGPYQRLRAG